MAHPNTLSCDLQRALPPNHIREILGHLWDLDSLPRHLTEVPGWGDSYLYYYKEQCKATIPNFQERLGISTHKNVVDVAHCLRDPKATRQSVKNSLTQVLRDSISSDIENRMLRCMNF